MMTSIKDDDDDDDLDYNINILRYDEKDGDDNAKDPC